ncbi:MAG: cysteine desulfurase family protein [Elusimicrobiota bacterium]|nr:cysteine desulfurase family protein [Elusimicrobiota bacterium]
MNKKKQIYLDYNSTTPCAPEVVRGMLPYFTKEFGNPSSSHKEGKLASLGVLRARELIANAIGANSRSLVFTSGATESNNLALLGVPRRDTSRKKILVSAIEHKSVLAASRSLIGAGYSVEFIPVSNNGVINLDAASRLIDKSTLIVSVQAANNETGAIQPIKEIARLAHNKGALCHCDAAQMLGKQPVRVEDMNVDLASFSAHKVYGPKGIGVLFFANDNLKSSMRPLLWGGGQEDGIRSGTLNVPGIIGFGKACDLVSKDLSKQISHLSVIQDIFEKNVLRTIPEARINCSRTKRIPGTISLTIPGIPADMLMANTPELCVSNGSACNAGALEPSYVLLAMGVSRDDAEATIRISLGRVTTHQDVLMSCKILIRTIRELRLKLGV